VLLPRLASDGNLPTSASPIAGITGMHSHAWVVLFFFGGTYWGLNSGALHLPGRCLYHLNPTPTPNPNPFFL
jgi:hypothetical protein